jgi:molecular chaperone GrpE
MLMDEKKKEAGKKEAHEAAHDKDRSGIAGSDKDKKIAELTAMLQHLQADFENSRKRAEKEKEEFKVYAKTETISRFLPIIDNLELALKHVHEKDDFTEGVKLIFSQMVTELENMGVRKIASVGKPFDPRLHEALMADYSEMPKDIIIEEFQAGYTIGDRVLRPSKVKTSKGVDEGCRCAEKEEEEAQDGTTPEDTQDTE